MEVLFSWVMKKRTVNCTIALKVFTAKCHMLYCVHPWLSKSYGYTQPPRGMAGDLTTKKNRSFPLANSAVNYCDGVIMRLR